MRQLLWFRLNANLKWVASLSHIQDIPRVMGHTCWDKWSLFTDAQTRMRRIMYHNIDFLIKEELDCWGEVGNL